jgi:ABC-type lipoprotein release transport system permease subunit
MLVKMAIRNLLRRGRRTVITAITVAFGVLLSFVFTSTADYSYANIIDTSARMGYGHVTVEPVGYHKQPSLKKRLDDTAAIRAKGLTVDGVVAAVTRITGQAMFATATKSVGGMFLGLDPAQENDRVNMFLSVMEQGELFGEADGRQAVIGVKMAEKLDLALGKKLIWTTTDVTGEIVSQIARVGGLFRTGVDEVDAAFVMLPLDRVRKTLGYADDEATTVCLFVDDQRLVDRVAAEMGGLFPDDDVLTWRTTQADIAGFVAVDKASNYLFQFLVGLLIAAGILNTILMNVLERTHEFGVMLAVGTPPRKLFGLVVAESLLLGGLGLVIGALLSGLAYWYFSAVGVDLASLMGEDYDLGGVLIDPVVRAKFYVESAVAILAAVFALTAVAGLYPAWRAASLPPMESVKSL